MTQDDDIGTAYAAERQAAEDAALVAQFESEMGAETQTTATPTPDDPESGAMASVDAALANRSGGGDSPWNMAVDAASKNVREVPLQFVFGGVEGATRFADTMMAAASTALPAVSVATNEPGALGQSAGMDAAPTPDLTPEGGVGRKPTTLLGGLSRGVGQFLPGYGLSMKALGGLTALGPQMTQAGTLGTLKSMLAGAAAGTLDFDPNEPRISNFVQATGLANPLTEFLAADPADSRAEGLFKSAVENLGLGVATDGVMALARLSRARVAAKAALAESATKTPEQLVDDALRASSEVLDPQVPGLPMGDREAPLVSMVDDVEPSPLGERLASATNRAAGVGPEDVAGATPQNPQKVYLNLSRIDTADDVKSAIDTLASTDADAINAARGGETQSFAEVEALAADLGMKPADLVGRRRGPMGAAEAVAARKILTSSGEQLTALARKAGAPEATPADLAAFQRATAVHYAIQTEVIAARTETARALASWRIPAGADGSLRLSDLHGALAAAGGPEKVAEAARRLAMLADNPAAMSKAVEAGFRSTWGDVFKQVWFNGILSGAKTHARNFVGNSLTTAWAVPERMGTAAVSAFGSGDVQMGEASAMAWGAMKGTRDAFRAAGRALRTGEGSDLFNKLEVGRPAAISYEAFGQSPARTRIGNLAAKGAQNALGSGLDAIGSAIDLPGRLLMSSDEFFKSINYRMELHAQAFRTAVGEGLSGEDLAARITDLTADPTPAMQEAAQQFARTQTFTAPLGEIGAAVTKLRSKVPGATFVMPFVRTPANIAKYTFERTPLAPLSSRIRGDIAAGGARGEAALARMGLGTAAMIAAADMVANGELVGGGPGEPSMRAGRERQGIPQYAFKLGDQWVTYNGLDPFGMLLGMGADGAEIVGLAEGEEQDRSLAALGLLFVNAAASKTYLSGLFDFVDAIDSARDSAQPMAMFTQRLMSSAVPFSGFISGLKAVNDPVQRETRTSAADPAMEGERQFLNDPAALFVRETINRIKARTPGWSETLPPKRDLWGRPVEYNGNLGVAYDMASPVQIREDRPDAVDAAIVGNAIEVQMPERSIQGVPLTGEEYSRYVQLAGEPAKMALDDLVSSPDFKVMSDGPDGMKALRIKDVVAKFRQAAKGQMLAEFPSLMSRVQAKAEARGQYLTGVQP